jgi:DNA-directed RNA polymerase specialized sigma24 family protein
LSQPTRATFRQVRDLYRLIGDVRAAGAAGAAVQRQMLVDGACVLLDADQGFISEFDDYVPDRTPREVETVPSSRLDGRCMAFIRQWYATRAVEQDAMGAALYEAAAKPGATAITWRAAKRHKPASRYGQFYELCQTIRLADLIDPMSRHPSGHMVALSLHRLGRARPFSAREQALARLLAEELAWLHRTRRLDVRDLLGRTLPPRLHELLHQLLGDRSMKQIAAAMGLSVHTARKYGDDLYKRLQVGSREELMVRYVTGAGR